MITEAEVTTGMASGTFRLKGRELLKKYDKTMYRVSEDGGVGYSTIHRWIKTPEQVERIEGKALFGFLLGLGLTLDEVHALPFGDVFEFIPDNGQSATE